MAGNTVVSGNMVNIGTAVVQMVLNTQGVQDGVKEARSILSKGLGFFKDFLTNPAVGWNLGNQFTSFVQNYLQEAKDLERFAAITDETVKTMAIWTSAAEDFGTQASTLGDIFADMSDKISDYATNRSGPIEELVKKGLFDDFNGDTAPKTLNFLTALSEKLRSVSRQEQVGILKRLGINDPGFLSMMIGQKDTLEQIIEKSKDAAYYTETDIKNAKKFTGALREISKGLKAYVIPTIGLLLSSGIQLFRNTDRLIPVFAALAAVISTKVVTALTAMTLKAVIAKVVAFGLWLMLFGLVLAFESFVTWANGGESALSDFFDTVIGSRERGKAFLDTLREYKYWIFAVVAAFAALKAAIGIAGILQKTAAGLKLFFGIVKSGVAIIWKFAVAMYAALGPWLIVIIAIIAAIALLIMYWSEVKEAIGRVKEAISALYTEVTEWAAGVRDSFLDAVKNAIDGAINLFTGWWNDITSLIDWDSLFSLPSWEEFKGKLKSAVGMGDVTLAASGPGRVNSSVENTQTIVQNFNGDTSKQTIEAATAGATDGGLFGGSVNSLNYG